MSWENAVIAARDRLCVGLTELCYDHTGPCRTSLPVEVCSVKTQQSLCAHHRLSFQCLEFTPLVLQNHVADDTGASNELEHGISKQSEPPPPNISSVNSHLSSFSSPENQSQCVRHLTFLPYRKRCYVRNGTLSNVCWGCTSERLINHWCWMATFSPALLPLLSTEQHGAAEQPVTRATSSFASGLTIRCIRLSKMGSYSW